MTDRLTRSKTGKTPTYVEAERYAKSAMNTDKTLTESLQFQMASLKRQERDAAHGSQWPIPTVRPRLPKMQS